MYSGDKCMAGQCIPQNSCDKITIPGRAQYPNEIQPNDSYNARAMHHFGFPNRAVMLRWVRSLGAGHGQTIARETNRWEAFVHSEEKNPQMCKNCLFYENIL